MRIRTILATAAVGFIAAGSAPAFAAGNEQSGPTVGNCLSDIFYGNEPNVDADGNTVASQSPGPKKTLSDGSVVVGSTVGDYQQQGISIPALCRAAFGPQN